MKKYKLIVPFFALGALLSGNIASAADGTIYFSGLISANTCTVTVNGSTASSATVGLPTVSTTSLTTAGETSGRTPFSIELTNCSITEAVNASTYFEPGSLTTADGRLALDSASTATNVEIQILNSNQGIMNITNTSGNQNDAPVALSVGVTGATLNYYAQYYATAQATAGDVISRVNYTIIYN